MLCPSLAAMSPAPSPEKADRKPPFWLGYATSAPQVKLISVCIPLGTGMPVILFVAGRFGVRACPISRLITAHKPDGMRVSLLASVWAGTRTQLLLSLTDSALTFSADRGSECNRWQGTKHLGHICCHSRQNQRRVHRYACSFMLCLLCDPFTAHNASAHCSACDLFVLIL